MEVFEQWRDQSYFWVSGRKKTSLDLAKAGDPVMRKSSIRGGNV